MTTKPDPYEWIAENLGLVYHICRGACKGRYDLVEDLYSEVALEKIPGIVERWDPKVGTLNTFLYRNLRWYMHTWMIKRLPQSGEDLELLEGSSTLMSDFEGQEEVQYLLKALTGYERRIVKMHLLEGKTFLQIGQEVGYSKSAIIKHYQKAIAVCREDLRMTIREDAKRNVGMERDVKGGH